MRHWLALALAVGGGAAFAQNSTDDQPAQELWWDRVGSAFFSDSTMGTLRSEDEIRAQLTGLSAEDRAQLLRRCDELKAGAAASTQPGNAADLTGQGAVGAETLDAPDPLTGDQNGGQVGGQADGQADVAQGGAERNAQAGGDAGGDTSATASGDADGDATNAGEGGTNAASTITGEPAARAEGATEPQVAASSGTVAGNTGLGPSPAVFTRVCDLMARF